MSDITITPDLTMEEVLRRAPAAQRALFQRYHIGGCSHCAFQPDDTLGQVAKDHNVLDINDMVRTIVTAQEFDGKIQVEPTQVKEWLDAGEDFSFIDCRTPDDRSVARIEAAEFLDYEQSGKYMGLPKERRLVFVSHKGDRSLDVATYFIGHGFSQVFSVRGGVDAWSQEVDAAVPRY